MKAPRSTILDVVDNFTTAARVGDIAALPGTDPRDFGKEMRRYTQAVDVPTMDQSQHPIYLGGWPSANFGSVNGAMLLSRLLYSGQILVKGRLADWFCDEQYFIENKLSARPGHRNHDRIEEAEQHNWLGEAEGLKVSLAAATLKLSQMEMQVDPASLDEFGMPAVRS